MVELKMLTPRHLNMERKKKMGHFAVATSMFSMKFMFKNYYFLFYFEISALISFTHTVYVARNT